MTIRVNGEETQVPDGLSVRGLIVQLGLGQAACAAEVNRALVPRRQHESRMLVEGDVVELVSLVGGG